MLKNGVLNAILVIGKKTQGQNRKALQPIYTGEPFERVAIDIISFYRVCPEEIAIYLLLLIILLNM